MTQLSEHIEKSGRTRADFAKAIGISGPFLSQILSGDRRPSFDVMLKIEAETAGEVTIRSWVPTSEIDKAGSK